MNEEEIGQMESELHSIATHSQKADGMRDIVLLMLSMNDRIKELEERKRIRDGIKDAINDNDIRSEGYKAGYDKGYSDGFDDGVTATSTHNL